MSAKSCREMYDNYVQSKGRTYAAVGSLVDAQERSAVSAKEKVKVLGEYFEVYVVDRGSQLTLPDPPLSRL